MNESNWKISYPGELPISARIEEIKQIWRENQVVIVCGATGSGKTTQLPKVALDLGWDEAGLIGCTQPRRLAATAMAGRLARELQVNLGLEVGYQVRFDDRTQRGKTAVKFMTDGILLAETAGDPKFRRYSCLIIDEAHERSLNIDFILGYLKTLLPKRPDLKIAISSATLDAEKFSAFFNDAPVVEVAGRQYEIEDLYLEPEVDEDLSDFVGRGVRFLDEYDRRGDILIFLPGEREIRDAADLLSGWNLPNTEILPLFGRLSLREQERVFQVGRRRRIVLATNVAETSITIPGIDYVIDSGLVRLSRYNARTQVQELQIEFISQAAARQRRGRCGRLRDGICLHLYAEETLQKSQDYTDPEIKRTALAGVILQMAMLRLPKIEHFPLIDPPSSALIREGRRALLDIGAITDKGQLTPDGRQIATLPVDPHLAKMILYAARHRLQAEVLVLCGFLSLQDPRERPLDAQQQADEKHRAWRDERSDYIGTLKLWDFLFGGGESVSNSALRRICRANFLNFGRVKEWKSLVEDLNDSLKECALTPVKNFQFDLERLPYDLLHQSLLAGIPRHVGCFDAENQIYDGTAGRKFHLFPGSSLFKRKKKAAWVMTFALVDTTRLFARQNAEIRPEYLEAVAPHLCTAFYDQAHFDPKSGFVYARERLTFGGLLVHNGRRVHYGKSHPVEARAIFIREALVAGAITSRHKVLRKYLELLASLHRLEIKVRRPGTVVDLDALIAHFEALLPPEIISQQALERWLDCGVPANWLPAREELMLEQYHPLCPDDYPDTLRVHGHNFTLRYVFEPGEEHDGVTLYASGDELAMIPQGEVDFLIPGWLPEKVELMLKALPKNRRVHCLPLQETVEAYCEFALAPDADHSIGLAASLAQFLSEWCEVDFHWREFEEVRLPEYLTMKIAELDEAGEIVQIYRELPEHLNRGSRVGASLRAVARHQTEAAREWPSGAFPCEIALDSDQNRIGYPALNIDGEGVARQVFLLEAEARKRHAAGLVRLFRLKEGGLVKFVKRSCRFGNDMQLGMLRFDREKRYADDLIDRAAAQSLAAQPDGLWAIRDNGRFLAAVEQAKMSFAENADRLLEEMANWQAMWHETLTPLLKKAENRAPEATATVRGQLAFYFRPGFLQCPELTDRYPRYLRSAALRLERAINDPGKDTVKAAPLEAWLERSRLAEQGGADPVWNDEFLSFRLLLEEWIITAFSPEIRPLEKASEVRIEKLWHEVRL